MSSYNRMTVAELAARLGSDNEPFLLDVREPDEVSEWSIPEAYNIPLGQLPSRLSEIPRDKEVVTMCASGGRSTTAAEFLSGQGFQTTNLLGGMSAWGQLYDTATLSTDELKLVQVRRRGKGCLSYLIGGEGIAFVVDPSLDIDVYLELAKENNWEIKKVFDTHLHADHLSGAKELAEATSATLYLNPEDTFDFPYQPLSNGDTFELPGGHHFKVGAWYAPGHTNGSTIFEISDLAVLTGDTLFVDGVGRPDLADKVAEFAGNLHKSLSTLVLSLPEHIQILPAHYSDKVKVRPNQLVGSTLGQLKSSLEPLSMTKEEFIAWAEEKTTPRPPNYAEIIKVNMGRGIDHPALLRHLEAGPNRCSTT